METQSGLHTDGQRDRHNYDLINRTFLSKKSVISKYSLFTLRAINYIMWTKCGVVDYQGTS